MFFFFHMLRDAWKFSSCKYIYSTFSQQIATASLKKVFTNIANQQGHFRRSMLLAVGACALIFYMTRIMIERNITNHGLEKKKSALLWFIWRQNNFLSRVFALKMDKFVLKVKPRKKPCSTTPQEQAKQYPGKFHGITISYFVQHVMFLWITTESQFLASTFQLFHTSSEWMNPLRSEGNNRHWRLHLSAKLQLTKISRKRWTLDYYCVKANIYRWSINAY